MHLKNFVWHKGTTVNPVPNGAKFNVALYGRDDVHPAVQLQHQIIQRITAGFCPVIPLLRGGVKPVSDRPVSLPAVADQVPGPDQFPLCLPDTADLFDTDSDESDIDQRDGPSEDISVPLVQMKSFDCIFLLNVSSHIAHVAACCEAKKSMSHSYNR